MKKINWIIFITFLILTFCLLFQRQPFYDEAHAWMIAKSFGFFELFQIEKYEGHLFLWHTILSPFAKHNLFYPYSMYIINWLFCAGAIFVMWKYAPFSTLKKTLITFSYPFFWYFALVARCYSVGIFLFFIILSLWKERLKHPLLISFLLALFINTSAMAGIGAAALIFIFLFDLSKNQKENLIAMLAPLTIIAGAVLALIQTNGAHHISADVMASEHIYLLKFFVFFFFFDAERLGDIYYILDKISAIFIMLSCLFALLTFLKDKRTLIFYIFTFLFMNYIFIFEYSGAWWHYMFFFIYLIGADWIFEDNCKNYGKPYKIFNALFICLLITFCSITIFFNNYISEVYTSKTTDIAKIIKNENLFKPNYKIYTLDYFSQTSKGLPPYFPNLSFYNVRGNKLYTEEEFLGYEEELSHNEFIDKFANSLDKDKVNVGISDGKALPAYEGGKFTVKLKLLFESKKPKFMIYEIQKYERKNDGK